MTPKEKAKELIESFMPLVESFSEQQQFENARKCALMLARETYNNCIEGLDEFWVNVIEAIKNYQP